MNKTDPKQQQRVILAVALSFLFFIVYGEFFAPKVDLNEQNQSVISAEANKGEANSQGNEAPQISSTSVNSQIEVAGSETNSSQNLSLATIESAYFKAQIDALGRISSFELKGEKFKDENNQPVQLVSKTGVKPLELRFSDATINRQAFETPYTASASNLEVSSEGAKLVLKQSLNGLEITKTLTFYEKGNYDIDINLSKESPYFISTGSRPQTAKESYVVRGALVVKADETLETFEDGDVSSQSAINESIIISAFDAYYATLFYNFESKLNAVISNTGDENPLAFASAIKDFKAGGYIGAKEHSTLRAIDERLILAVEYGWFTFIAKPIYWCLEQLHNSIGNWGWTIVVLTLIIRVILFPLTYRSMISMNKLKDLAPRMKDIREKYKGDPQKMNMHMMELYKKHGANPFAGCLPILLQIPIFFAIYRVLLNAVELKAAPWAFWIHDLSIMDPYFILPILMGVMMFAQQLITPMAIQDPTQAKIMKFLPVIFTFFFLWFPAGLTLYWCVNNLCSLVQQWVVNKLFEKEHHKKQRQENEN